MLLSESLVADRDQSVPDASCSTLSTHQYHHNGFNHNEPSHTAEPDLAANAETDTKLIAPANPFSQKNSKAAQEWELRKQYGESCSALDELMQCQGLEEVKQHLLDLKSKVDICKAQDPQESMNILGLERFSAIFQGNPGTGKTMVARIYAKFLYETAILPSEYIEETSGMKVALEGGRGIKDILENIDSEDGGVLFIDEAYQLMSSHANGSGKQALDIILTELEDNIGKLAVILVGYKDDMAPFFQYNQGLESRIPYIVNFADFDNGQLWCILMDKIQKQYHGGMRVEGGLDGLYMRIAVRRLAQARGSRSFGNARAIENLLARIRQRQARRLTLEKLERRQNIDYLMLTKGDLIGPDPSTVANISPAWIKLHKLIGLEQVKKSATDLIGMIELNFQRELREEPSLKFSLNQVFVGAPGTGKTTVAQLYGQILADLGYLSCGEVVMKTPADFLGNCLGQSEDKTRQILESTVGKVLVIDEAYMLHAGNSQKDQDQFKTGIIDTIVSMTSGAPGEDRCIILVGYKDKIHDLFQHANPGFSRRFPIERPFQFENFTFDQLEEILRLRISEDNLTVTNDAIFTARNKFMQALMRPNFTNAGAVDKTLAMAKMNYATRLLNLPPIERLSATTLEAVDFDTEVGRRGSSEVGCDKMLNGLVDRRIIDKLISYEHSYRKARKLNLNPRTLVPTNFIFKGPSGTGKSVTAQHMGILFYDMGFISTKEVVECSATDLIGQYVGHTAPKTNKKLQEGLGGVLIINEANRLMNGSFAAEAVDELLQFLLNPSYAGKMVIILAGLTADINKLLSQYPMLSSLFPDEIVFEEILTEDCIELLVKELKDSGIGVAVDFLADQSTGDYSKVRQLLRLLGAQPGWSNARDVKALTKQIVRQYISTPDLGAQPQQLPVQCVTECIEQMIAHRKGRTCPSNLPSNSDRSSSRLDSKMQEISQQSTAPPSASTHQQTTTPQLSVPKSFIGKRKRDIDTDDNPDSDASKQKSSTSYKPQSQSDTSMARIMNDSEREKRQRPVSTQGSLMREDGVSDAVWQNLCKVKKVKATKSNQAKKLLDLLREQIMNAEKRENKDLIVKLQGRLIDVEKQVMEEEKIQNALQAMGRCVYGYSWTKQEGGYRCEGGSHFVSDTELLERL
ncbi:hypothetical protein TGAMA5MH_08843 [Trichoderma gamsii]|uniref:AAA+ ATPase domain-containing protein n=1 Tax=Trichoderma gamsii TaxID=398673 RepID=A0A2K0T0V9_9HYPO|nr:hypothetical protein TGAMA5MH_08843 [Trichoderma gamsii]